MKNQVTPSPVIIGAKYGLISGLVGIIYSLILYVIDPELIFNFKITSVGFIILIVLMVLAAREYKSQNNGYLTYGNAFLTTFFVGVISSIASVIFMYALMRFIDPSLVELQRNLTIETSLSLMESFGTPEDQIEEAIEQIENQDLTPTIANSFLGILGGAFFSSIIALIVSIFVKKAPKETF